MIDANETINSKEHSGIKELMDKCNLVNLYSELHDDNLDFPTHINGSQAIDFMLCTPNLVEHVWKMGYIPFYECYDSDHRGLFCDIKDSILIDNKQSANIIKKRMVGSNSTNAEGTKYINKLYTHLLSNNIISNASNLLESIINKTHNQEAAIKQLNMLDRSVTNAMLKIEKQTCKKKEPVLWTPEIRQSNLRLKYWNISIESTKQRIDADERLKHILEQRDEDGKKLL
jgi:hypothetical protein